MMIPQRLLKKSLMLALMILSARVYLANASRHETCAEFLKKHGVELTEEGLVSALRNHDPEIRDNAAQELANRKDVGAVSAIEQALATENDPGMQVNLAYAAAQLGDENGFAALKRFCETALAVPRLKAALYMLRFNDESCFSGVISILQSKPEKGEGEINIATAMSLVPSFHNLSPSDEQRLITLTMKHLADPAPFARITASQTLTKVGGADLIPVLQQAITEEKDDVTRSAMQAELVKLQTKPKEK